jgi:predicted TIM-barrel fold metal-dependent hydrolase
MPDAPAELRIPVLNHPKEVDDFYMVAEEYPQVQFIMAHMGGYSSWTKPMDGIGLARCFANVSVDTSQVPVKFIDRAVKSWARRKIVF